MKSARHIKIITSSHKIDINWRQLITRSVQDISGMDKKPSTRMRELFLIYAFLIWQRIQVKKKLISYWHRVCCNFFEKYDSFVFIRIMFFHSKPWWQILSLIFFLLETAFFTSIQISDSGRKIGLLSFYSVTIYVCMYVCMYVCVCVCIRATAYTIWPRKL